MRDLRYATLVKVVDGIGAEAPETDAFQRFRSTKREDVVFSRSQAFMHLFLLVKFGLESFEERNDLICDGPGDGGLDGYCISEGERVVYLIQAKFRSSDSKFVGESVSASDLVRMELDRILDGETHDSNGVPYNEKVLEFQESFRQATRKQVYNCKVVFLANLKSLNDFQVRKLTNRLDYEVYDFERTYVELVKPICSATYYDPEKISIELNLSEKSTPQLSQTIRTTHGDCDVTAVFVPTREIGRVMSRYKNAILRYNPRNYLGLSRNAVNREIRQSISSLSHNDFALLNNGITILADRQELTLYTGEKNVGRLTLFNPQIINGGQTAYTLSDIYEKELERIPRIFDGKEVLVRVVVLKGQTQDSVANKHDFIDAISTATNRQTLVKEADRHSRNPVLVKVQDEVFRRYGYFVELKQGEFHYGRERGYIGKEHIIDRIIMLRAFVAFSGQPTPARGYREALLFERSFFGAVFPKRAVANLPQTASEIFYAYRVHQFLATVQRKEDRRSLRYGYALRYGKYAVVYASALVMDRRFRRDLSSRSLSEVEQYLDQSIIGLLDGWKTFEDKVQKHEHNGAYFNPAQDLTDFDSYYKGTTLKADLVDHFSSRDDP